MSSSLSAVAPVDHVRLERPILSQVSSTPREDQTCQPLPQYSVCPTAVRSHPPPPPARSTLLFLLLLLVSLYRQDFSGISIFCPLIFTDTVSLQSSVLFFFYRNTLRQQTHTTSCFYFYFLFFSCHNTSQRFKTTHFCSQIL